PIRPDRDVPGLAPHAGLPRRRAPPARRDRPRAVQFGDGHPVLAAGRVRRTYTQPDHDEPDAGAVARLAGGVCLARVAHPLPAAAVDLAEGTHFPYFSGRRLRHAPGHRRPALPAAPALPARAWHAGLAIGPHDDAGRRRGDGNETDCAESPGAL